MNVFKEYNVYTISVIISLPLLLLLFFPETVSESLFFLTAENIVVTLI
jgi:hypothetical protein